MLDTLKHFVSSSLLIPLICLVGFYFSYQLRFLQITHWLKAWRLILSDRDHSQGSSSFSAVAAVLGGNLGTGNIAGIAVALAAGGPGALFWMWVMAFLGSILKFIGTVFGVMYRQKNDRGEFVGGPMYYLRDGLGSPTAATLFCLLTILSACTVGNLVQVNSMALPLASIGVPLWLTGGLMSLLVGVVILGGLSRFSMVVSKVVPLMAFIYFFACMVILVRHASHILPSLSLIFHAAMHPVQVASGVGGYMVFEGVRAGFDRGLFATDVGAGLAPIIHSSVPSETTRFQTALHQGLISTVSPILVMVVCTLTGLVLMVTGAWLGDEQSTNVCIEAFRLGFDWAPAGHLVTITLFFFAFTTILTWVMCAGRCVAFLTSEDWVRPFKVAFILLIPTGAYLQVNMVWTLADLFMNGMLIVNLLGLMVLGPRLIRKINAREDRPEKFKRLSSAEL